MEFVEFHAEATGLTTSSTITLPFDRSITSASDVKGVVLMAQGRVTNFGWTMISHGWSVGVYDGTNEMCKWAGATRGSSDESEYREHWYDNAILVNWDESTNSTYAVCSISSISTTGITLAVDDVAGTNVALKIRGYAIVGSDVTCEAKSVIQSTLTSGATTDLDYSTLTSVDVVMGWAFDNDQITNTLLPDDPSGTSTDYRGHYSPGQWFATTDGTRAMWGKTQDGGTLVDTAIYQKTDGKVYCTVIDVTNTLFETYVSASLQHGGTANRVRLTNDGSQSRGWGMVTLAIETSNQTAIGTMKRDVSDTGTETIAPGFTGVGLVQTMSMAGFGNDEDVPAEDQTNGNQFSINFGMGGNVRTSDAGVGCFGMSLSMRDANGAVRYRNVHWTASANTTMAASEADSDWLNEVAATQFAPGSTTGTTNNDVVYQYISAVNGTTGDMTVTYQDPTATGSTNKGMRTYWLAIEEGGAAAGQTLDLDTSNNAIPSAETFGTASLDAQVTIEPTGIASEEATGAVEIVLDPYVLEQVGGIAPTLTMGNAPTLVQTGGNISPSGFEDDNLLGVSSPSLIVFAPVVDPSGVASEETFGLHQISSVLPIDLGVPPGGGSSRGIGSEEDFGTANVDLQDKTMEVASFVDPGVIGDHELDVVLTMDLGPQNPQDDGAGIESEEAFGSIYVDMARWDISLAAGIPSQEEHGQLHNIIPPNPVLTVSGIESEESFDPTVVLDVVLAIQPSGIDESAVGEPTLATSALVEPTAFDDTEAFGSPALGSSVVVEATGIDESAVGEPSLAINILVEPTAFDDTEAFGSPGLDTSVVVEGIGIESEESFDPTVVLDVTLTIQTSGIDESAVGEPSLASSILVEPTAFDDTEAFGSPGLGATVGVDGIGFEDGAEDIGSPTLEATIDVTAEGFEDTEAFGSINLDLNIDLAISPDGLSGGEVGEPSLHATIDVLPEGFEEAQFGSATVAPQEVLVNPEGFPDPTVITDPTVGQPAVGQSSRLYLTGIGSKESVSYHEVVGGVSKPRIQSTIEMNAQWDVVEDLTATRDIVQNINASTD